MKFDQKAAQKVFAESLPTLFVVKNGDEKLGLISETALN